MQVCIQFGMLSAPAISCKSSDHCGVKTGSFAWQLAIYREALAGWGPTLRAPWIQFVLVLVMAFVGAD
jgi:hypothetical protein